MTHVLLISYEFPPKGGTQSQHVAGLARGLVACGCRVTVLTVADPPTTLFDAGALDGVAGELEIVTAWSLEPTRVVQAVKRLRRSRPKGSAGFAGVSGPTGGGSRGYTSLPRWAIRFVQAVFVPDEKVGWSPWAVRAAVRIHAERQIDVVLASGPPFSAYGVAWRVARRIGVPWVADLRDPIVGGYFFRPFTPVNRWLIERFERTVIARAAHVLTSTDRFAEEILERHPAARGRVETVPNGFDPAAFAGPDPVRTGFTVAYVGTFQATIRPDVFLEAVAALRKDAAAVAADLRVRFVGPLDPETGEAVQRMGLEDVVERAGFVPQADALSKMRAADVLLLVLGPEPESTGILPSKLPEYLGAGRPVLALVPDGVAADVVRRAGAGEVVAPDDVAGVVAALERLHAQWRAGTLPVPDAAVVAEFDRSRLVARYAEILERVATARGQG